jgi:hypothetical protein
MALELGMDVRDDGQCPENANLSTNDHGVSSHYQSGTENAEHMEID